MKANNKVRSFSPRFIAAAAVTAIIFTSCTSVSHLLEQSKSAVSQTQTSEPLFIEDFYTESPAAGQTKAPEPDFNFERTDAREEHIQIEIAEQRTLDEELYEESLSDGDIGGEDVIVSENVSDKILETVPVINASSAEIPEAKFDPAKMVGAIQIDILMQDMSCFTMPVPGVINSNFGWRHGRVHSGTDLDLETGDPVLAALDGEVTTAEYHGGYGNLVVLKHANGMETYYAHLSKIEVKVGDQILSGQELGLGGSTGRSTGPHLHFETRYMGSAFDPALLVDFSKQELKTDHLVLDKTSFKVVNQASKNNGNTTTSAKKYYTVKKGDTLGKIASRNKTTVSKICKLNSISSKKILKPGMKLRIK